MDAEAPAILQALEGSGLGAAIRQSVWIYPAANVGHVVALVGFTGSVAVLDLAILGTFGVERRAAIVERAQRAAVLGLVALAATGFLLFTAEASHVGLNPVLQTKAALIVAGILNALAVRPALQRALAETPPRPAMPTGVRTAAALSLGIWITVAALGRLIAYF
jgi:hypothetical protein